jgi:hypothetical protein
VSALDPSLSALLSEVEILLPLKEIVQLFATSSTWTLVGDGGAKTCRGSYGAVAALGTARILQLKGPVTGPDPRSYCAEAHTIAAVILCTVILHKVAPPHHAGSYQSLDIFSDNQGLVDKIKEMMEWEKFYPSSGLLSEWDILSVIMEFTPQLPLRPAVQHVKGHQDRDSPAAARINYIVATLFESLIQVSTTYSSFSNLSLAQFELVFQMVTTLFLSTKLFILM